ncbi:sigma-70 family RNA polymerase sigma factor [Micromonospora sp. NPDC048935]|uniref:sigma-70 family RNA polymerase sigma factor n=1 Tax=Micromonospora sp. NPDC048935 TaxID=3364262 RepID=UPI0037221872
MDSDEVLAARFEQDRQHLRAVAHRLVGSVHDADDVVQQTWIKASQADLSDVANLRGWLTTVTARQCLDLLRARRRRGEVLLDDGIETAGMTSRPTAVTRTGEEEVLLAESVGLALLVVLDRLSPAQRVAFVLHDLFSVPFEEIGQVMDRSPAAAKKLASRARDRVYPTAGEQPVHQRQTAEHLLLVDAFLAASRGGDLPVLLDLLAPDVVRRVDRILVPDDVATEIRGARLVAEETKLFTVRSRASAVAWVDGAPGIVIAPRGRLQAALRLGIVAGLIQTIDVIGEPGRLDRLTIAVTAGHGPARAHRR